MYLKSVAISSFARILSTRWCKLPGIFWEKQPEFYYLGGSCLSSQCCFKKKKKSQFTLKWTAIMLHWLIVKMGRVVISRVKDRQVLECNSSGWMTVIILLQWNGQLPRTVPNKTNWYWLYWSIGIKLVFINDHFLYPEAGWSGFYPPFLPLLFFLHISL